MLLLSKIKKGLIILKNDNKDSLSRHLLSEKYDNIDFYSLSGKSVSLTTLGNTIPLQDINDFENTLKEHNINFSKHDIEGKIQASDGEFFTLITLVVHSQVLTSILTGMSPAITWDAIKYFSKKSWESIKGKTYNKYSNGSIEEKQITFSIEAKIHNNSYIFNFKDVDPENTDVALDKILDFFKEQNTESWKTYIAQYEESSEKWKAEDLNDLVDQIKNEEID